MKYLRLLILMQFFIITPISHADTKTPFKPEPQLLIENILSEIQKVLIRVQTRARDTGLPPLSSVNLTLSTQFSGKVGAKLSFFIISVGGGVTKESVQTLKLTLVPPKAGARDPKSTGFAESLSTAIVNAAKAVKEAEQEKPPLTLKELSATIKFVVKKEGEGGAKFIITPVTVDLGGNIQSVETQEIGITFKIADKKDPKS